MSNQHLTQTFHIGKTIAFLQHIFGTAIVPYNNNGELIELPRYDLALDYLSILFKYPLERLPVIHLTGAARPTGKTTFFRWLEKVFPEYSIRMSSDEFASDTLESTLRWTNKQIVCIDEVANTHGTIEKVRRIQNSNAVAINLKYKAPTVFTITTKFILCNSESGNSLTNYNQHRFWKIEVPEIEKINPVLIDDLALEIPQFIEFLSNRKPRTIPVSLFWFDDTIIQ